MYNRLASGLPVGIDTAFFYQTQNRDRDLTLTVDLVNTPGPYNLRVGRGLPPTPIAGPGEASLQAAIDPADGPWLYYAVADEAGNLVFTDSLQEHQANVIAARERGLVD